MHDPSDSHTSPTLLGKLHANPRDQIAWQDFERRYGEMIRRWCRRWGLQSSDADDLTQTVLLALSKQMEQFRYDRSRRFRGWLKTITHRTWCDFLESQRRRAAVTGDSVVMRLLDQQEMEEDFFSQLEQEWKRELLEEALKRVQPRVQPHTWEAFRLLTYEGLAGADVAEKLGMKVGAVWVAGSKVRKMIQQEIHQLQMSELAADDLT